MDMPRRPLGASGIEVSRLSLGSWRTFERISKDAGLEVMRAARAVGINFLDDARYNDETGKAPIPTGYSEVLFGELFRGAGWPRDETIVCNKLWWEFWPDQSAAEELDGSLGRMGLDHIDVIYANVPPDGLPLDQMVHDVGGLIVAGKARAWAIVNWPADQLLELSRTASREGVPQPVCAQLAVQPRAPLAGRGRRHAHHSGRVRRPRRRCPTSSREACSAASTTPTPRRAGQRAHSTSRCTPRPRTLPDPSRSSPIAWARLRPRSPWRLRCSTPLSRLFSSVRPGRLRSKRTSPRLEVEARLTAADRAELIAIGT